MSSEIASILKNNIISYTSRNNVSIKELSRRSGLSDATILNILHGRSKNPGIEAIYAIAKEVNCSIEDLISNETSLPKQNGNKNESLYKKTWDKSIFLKCINYVDNYVNINDIISESPALEIIKCAIEIYSYCNEDINEKNNEDLFDKKFAKYICEKFFDT